MWGEAFFCSTCPCVLHYLSALVLIVSMHTTCNFGCTWGSTSQRTGWDVGRTWITSAGISVSSHRSGGRGGWGGGLLCFTKGASCAYGLLCAPFQVHSTCIVGRTVVIRDTDRCILGSESQRTGWEVGLAWIASGGILVRCRGSWGGGGVAPERLPWLPIEAPWPPPLHHMSMHYSPHGHQQAGIPSGCGVPRG